MKTQITLSAESLELIEKNVRYIMSNDRLRRDRSEEEVREELMQAAIDRAAREAKKLANKKKYAGKNWVMDSIERAGMTIPTGEPTPLQHWTNMFSMSRWNNNTLWNIAANELPTPTNDFLQSLVDQFLSGKQLSDKQAYYLAKAKVEQA